MNLAADFSSLLQTLRVPSEFSRYDRTTESDVLARLNKWKNDVHRSLAELRDIVAQKNDLALHEQAQVISAAAAFDGSAPWVSPCALSVSREILALFDHPQVPLVEIILVSHLKPLFRSNPHPSLNLSTGRKLSRPAGGPLGSQDFYEGQTWKEHPGTVQLVSWCVRHIETLDYEKIWHSVLPPVMTLLDDYEAAYKVQGIEIVAEMLKRVPSDLLRRTGVDGLLLSSLNTCLHHLQNPETPAIIRTAVPTLLSLIELTTRPESSERFDQLCALLGEGIIGGIWLYCSNELEVLIASVEVLPAVIAALGIGSARYLKSVIPQLLHPLLPSPLHPPCIRLQLASIRALETVIKECAPRMYRWKGTIVEGGVGVKETVNRVEDLTCPGESLEVKRALQALSVRLGKSCPPVSEPEVT